MKINSIKIENFRNIKEMFLNFDDVNIIYGDNAQGKTNLIEAIYLFSGSKSFRNVKDSDLINFSSTNAVLNIDFFAEERNQKAKILIDGKRKVSINEIEKKSPRELGEIIKTIVFVPDHLGMIKNGPEERRKFVDLALCQIKSNYLNVLKNYNKALKQRNSVLKDIPKNSGLKSMLYIWNESLAKEGAKIIFQRQKYIESIIPYVRETFDGLSDSKETIDIKLIGPFEYENKSVEELEKELLKSIENNYSKDLCCGLTKIGPHLDDLDVLINGKSARLYGSQGQQRSCVLALKLAEASVLKNMTNIVPIALLDDVMSELDEKRQDYILNHIKNLQLFITCCDPKTILKLQNGKTIKIDNGNVIEE